MPERQDQGWGPPAGDEAMSGAPAPLSKKLRRMMCCAIGAAVCIGFALWLVSSSSSPPFLLASLGGSTVFLFGLTRTPGAQPRALFGGHLSSALIGIICFHTFGDALWVYVVAEVFALVFMLATKTVHPPAGANPLIMIHEHADFLALWQPVGVGAFTLVVITAAWTRLIPGMVHYPVNWFDRSPPSAFSGGWNE